MEKDSNTIRLLIVDDSEFDRENLKRNLSKIVSSAFDIQEACGAEDALKIVEDNPFDCLVVDYRMPGISGIDLCETLRKQGSPLPIVLLTGDEDESVALKSVTCGANSFLRKHDVVPQSILTAILLAVKRRQLDSELERSKEELQQALMSSEVNRLKAERLQKTASTFLSNMSHEMRTPLTSIIGFSEAIKYMNLSKKRTDSSLNAILSNGKHLLSIINDVLDYSQIEAGELHVAYHPLKLKELIHDIQQTFADQCERKGISFEVEIQGSVPGEFCSDLLRLKQILYNLMSNAVKFTQEGFVTIFIKFDSNSKTLRFIVKDTGIGIANDNQEKLFKAFSQADPSITREFGGTGLGLVISSQLALKLHGEITFNSVSGKGSEFILAIQLNDVDDACFITQEHLNLSDCIEESIRFEPLYGKVLIVDDYEFNRALMEQHLSGFRLQSEAAHDGFDAIEKIKSGSFDLVLMDIQMPGIDGIETTKKIRQLGYQQPVIAVTASVLDSAEKECRAGGCTAFLRKPFSINELYEALAGFLSPSSENSRNLIGSNELEESLPLEKRDAYRDIQRRYKERLPSQINDIFDAYESRDLDTLMMICHKLANAEMFGCKQLGFLSNEVQHMLKASKEQIDFLRLKSMLSDMKSEVERVTGSESREQVSLDA